jgi:hypothetical protein
MSQEIENRIRALITAKTTSQALSNALFGPMGLFGKLAKTEAERRSISQTPLFKQAHARIMEIEGAEIAAEIAEEMRRIEEICPPAANAAGELDGVAGPSANPSEKTPTAN